MAITVSPVDGNVFVSVSDHDGPENKLWKIDPKTRKMTDYPLPLPLRLSHGIDHSTDGIVWFSAGSGHLGRFDPKTEKFTYWELPGPKYPGTGKETGSTEYPYFLWVDQFDALGLGKNTVIVTGTSSDAMFIFDPKAERVHRLPYAVSAAVLHTRIGRSHRRREGRLEGSRALGVVQLLLAQVQRNADRTHQPHPAAAKSIGELSRSGCRASCVTPCVCRSIGRRRPGRRASACSP